MERFVRLLFLVGVLCVLNVLGEEAASGVAASGEEVQCVEVTEGMECDGEIFAEKEETVTDISTVLLYIAIIAMLVCTSGTMAGLTMGLMSLDIMNLQILSKSGTPKEQGYAKKIIPVIRRHHLLLVTLLLCNAGAMEALPIFLDRLVSPVLAIAISVSLILFFGEVAPQAVCSRYGLAIGAFFAPFIKVLMTSVFVITWPIAILLDILLGTEHQTIYRRSELRELVRVHEGGNKLTEKESQIIIGALDMIDKTVEGSMTPLVDVFMIDANRKLDLPTMQMLEEAGHSRVPVYEGDRQNVIGSILVKKLIAIDPDDGIPVRNLALNQMQKFRKDKSLYEILNHFQTGNSHMALVCEHSEGEEWIIGVITLEDVIEELIQNEILDETDVYVDVTKRVQLANLLRRASTDIRRISTDGRRADIV
eukprot:TRINITY_DN10641_c0_g1_i1.p1 TRINITY_DN10641_c0_g1~~TRINITY_DN10641_c0_g1_i1.p1  ORF type:complete len:431 (-),score=88.70 TRINITY_DN10641_c0_g1_i1:784-2049(-)